MTAPEFLEQFAQQLLLRMNADGARVVQSAGHADAIGLTSAGAFEVEKVKHGSVANRCPQVLKQDWRGPSRRHVPSNCCRSFL